MRAAIEQEDASSLRNLQPCGDAQVRLDGDDRRRIRLGFLVRYNRREVEDGYQIGGIMAESCEVGQLHARWTAETVERNRLSGKHPALHSVGSAYPRQESHIRPGCLSASFTQCLQF